jgi:hypothetical protein
MKLIETAVTETAVYMRLADHADPEKAKHWIDFQVPFEKLMVPAGMGENPLGDPELRSLAEVRLAALRYAREIIAAETQHLSGLVAHRRG